MTGIASTRRSEVRAVVEALSDPRFRKQRHFGLSNDDLTARVELAASRREQIELVGLMFTRKNVNPLKRGPGDESTVDLAELVSLIHLNSFAALVGSFHPYGARFTILSEGKRFMDAFYLSKERISLYQQRIQDWIKRLRLDHVRFIDYEDFLEDSLPTDVKSRRSERYHAARMLYEKSVGEHLHPDDMYATLQNAIAVDPVRDAGNPRNNFVPLWDSIKHSIPYPYLETAARERGIEYEALYRQVFSTLVLPVHDAAMEALRIQVLRRSWDAAIEHNARIKGDVDAGVDVAALISPAAIRTTINPRPQSPYLGIYSVRETVSRVQPWHGTAYLKVDGSGKISATVLTKLELESIGAIPVRVNMGDTTICFYASPEAVAVLTSENTPVFSMSTK